MTVLSDHNPSPTGRFAHHEFARVAANAQRTSTLNKMMRTRGLGGKSLKDLPEEFTEEGFRQALGIKSAAVCEIVHETMRRAGLAFKAA